MTLRGGKSDDVFFFVLRKVSMGSSDDDTDESLMRQILNMVLENNVFMPYIIVWGVFNLIMLAIMIYIAIRVSMKGN